MSALLRRLDQPTTTRPSFTTIRNGSNNFVRILTEVKAEEYNVANRGEAAMYFAKEANIPYRTEEDLKNIYTMYHVPQEQFNNNQWQSLIDNGCTMVVRRLTTEVLR